MSKIKIKDIEIWYNEDQSSKIDYIINIISKNYNLFTEVLESVRIISLIPTTDQNVLYVHDFDEFFYNIVDKLFNNDVTKQSYDIPNIMPSLYIEILIRKLKNDSSTLFHPNPSISDEMLDSLVAYKYYEKNGTFLEFVEYLKTRNKSDLVFDWLKKELRWDAYNYLLSIMVDVIKKKDIYLLNNIDSITTIMLIQSKNSAFNMTYENVDKLPLISLDELEKLFYDFLKYINAPKNWKQMYEDLKSSGRITFEDKVGNIDNSECYEDENGVFRLLISTDGTIECFRSIVHEFIHYVSFSKSKLVDNNYSITEFPSIYFEELSTEFLRSRGYQDNIIDEIINRRKESNLAIYIELSTLYDDILSFTKNGSIERQIKIEYAENKLKKIQEVKNALAKILGENREDIDLKNLENPITDIPSYADKDCDILTCELIVNGVSVMKGYQYLLGTFLANEVLKQSMTDPTTITRMIKVANELGSINLQDILSDFNLQELLNENKENNDNKNLNIVKKRTLRRNK